MGGSAVPEWSSHSLTLVMTQRQHSNFILSSLKAREYETALADDPDGAGKAELLAVSQSLLRKLTPLQKRQLHWGLWSLRDQPRDLEEALCLAKDTTTPSRKASKKRTGLLRTLGVRR